MTSAHKAKLETVCRILCKQNGGDPNERVDYGVDYGNGWRWFDYRTEARQILRALKRLDTAPWPKFRWTVELEVAEVWVADGFDLTDERAVEMLNNDLRYASTYELGAKIIRAPDPAAIRKAQGYKA